MAGCYADTTRGVLFESPEGSVKRVHDLAPSMDGVFGPLASG